MINKALEITPNIEPLFGTRDENLRLLEDKLHTRIDLRSDGVHVSGSEESVARVERIFNDYEQLRRSGVTLQNGELNAMLRLVTADPSVTLKGLVDSGKQRTTGGIKRMVQPRSVNQKRYVEAIEQSGYGLRYRASRHRQDVSRGGNGRIRPDGEAGKPHHPGATGG